ncbi:MAG: hypothetical protein V1907_01915 [Candidatus Kerfeldbacteria bacterium]
MAQPEQNQVIDHGSSLLSWKFPEIPHYAYTRMWYAIMTVIGLALLTYAIFSRNPLFAFIVIIGWSIFYYRSRQKPRVLTATIFEDGIGIGKDFFPFDDIKNFWIIYKPPAKTIYFTFKSALRPLIGIALEDANPVEIRKQLRRFIQEDLSKEDEATSDAIGRLFRI